MGCLKLTYKPTLQVLRTHEGTPSREAKVVQMWLSVDPKAADAPGWSPYRAFFCNPIRYTDPDGQWEKDANGNLVAEKGDKDRKSVV